jgi:hypothetical protein
MMVGFIANWRCVLISLLMPLCGVYLFYANSGVNFHGSHDAPDPLMGFPGKDTMLNYSNFQSFNGTKIARNLIKCPLPKTIDVESLKQAIRMMMMSQMGGHGGHGGHGGPSGGPLPGQHTHDGVNFHYSHDMPADVHTHDGVNFHGEHGGGAYIEEYDEEEEEFHGHSHGHGHGGGHGHDHEILDSPGRYEEREKPVYTERDWNERTFTVGIGGYVFISLKSFFGGGK